MAEIAPVFVATPEDGEARHQEATGPSWRCSKTLGDTPDLLVVCSIRRWVADDLRAGAAGRYPVRWDMGLDLPDLGDAETTAWWAPAEHAARLLRADVRLDLSAPGPDWLSRIPAEMTGRPIWSGRLSDLGEAPGKGWSKPAEAKVPGFPAAWRTRDELLLAAEEAGFPGDGWVQVSPVRLELEEEHRAFVLDGVVVAASPYLLGAYDGDCITYEPGWEDDASFAHDQARSYAQEVVDEMGDDQPQSYALDVGRTTAGRWVVVEANPAWCSGAYGCDLRAVADAVVASSFTAASPTAAASDEPSRHGRFVWVPDAYLVTFAEKAPVLRPRAMAVPHR